MQQPSTTTHHRYTDQDGNELVRVKLTNHKNEATLAAACWDRLIAEWIFRSMSSHRSGAWEASIPEHGRPRFRVM